MIPVSRQACFAPSCALNSETESGSERSWPNIVMTLQPPMPPLIRDSLAPVAVHGSQVNEYELAVC